MVTVEYQIDPRDREDLTRALAELSRARRRDGAFAWGLFEDVARPGRYLEYFMEESWIEHQRHHERVTKSDAEIQKRVAAYHNGEPPPRVTHLLGAAAS